MLKGIVTVSAACVLTALPILLKNSPYWMHVFIICCMNIGMAISLRLIFLCGEISVCHAAFMAIGAYTSAVLVKNLGVSFLVGLISGGVLAAITAMFIGFTTIRAKGIYFILTTLAFGEVVRLIIGNWRLLGAVNGFMDIPQPQSMTGIGPFGEVQYYCLILIVTLITVVACFRIEKSRYGLILASISQAPSLSESVGINIMPYKVMAFAAGCFFAGIYGSFYAHYTTVIHPDMFTLWHSIMFLIFFQVGGAGSIWGAVLGAFFLTFGAEILRAAKHLETVCYAAILIFIVLFMPGGLITLPASMRKVWDRINHKEKDEVVTRQCLN